MHPHPSLLKVRVEGFGHSKSPANDFYQPLATVCAQSLRNAVLL